MSGGHFNYNEIHLIDISENIERSIAENMDHGMSDDVIKCMKDIKNQVDKLYKLLHAADYLYSSDIGEQEFLDRYQSFNK
jgi:hypothetical protein